MNFLGVLVVYVDKRNVSCEDSWFVTQHISQIRRGAARNVFEVIMNYKVKIIKNLR